MTREFEFESEILAQLFVDRVALHVRDAGCVRDGKRVMVEVEEAALKRIESLARASYGSFRKV